MTEIKWSNECRTNVAKHLCLRAGDNWQHGRKQWLKLADEVLAIVSKASSPALQAMGEQS